MYVNGAPLTMKLAANASDLPRTSDPAGTFLFNPQLRTLWFTVRGGEASRDLLLVQVRALPLDNGEGRRDEAVRPAARPGALPLDDDKD